MRRSYEAAAVGDAHVRVFLETIAGATAKAVLRDLESHEQNEVDKRKGRTLEHCDPSDDEVTR